jgi:hypothetical protein
VPAALVAVIFVMGLVRGESQERKALLPVSHNELVPEGNVYRVIEVFVGSL